MLKTAKNTHLVGIKGVGLTALAAILKDSGCRLSGSDTKEKFFTDAVLKKIGIRFAEKFSAKNIPRDTELVISSAAYFQRGEKTQHPEIRAALKRKIPVLTYPEALGQLAADYKVIAIAGTNGKSTTTAMVGWVLEKAGLNPTVIVGTKVKSWESNARVGRSRWLVVEADEYREAFLNLKPTIAVITNIDYDHPDYFHNRRSYLKAFEQLASQITPHGQLIICNEDDGLKKLLQNLKREDLKILRYNFDSKISIPFPGRQYSLNAAAAITVAQVLKVPRDKAVQAIKSFPGTARRLETLARPPQLPYWLIDDYAHHPAAIAVTLEGLRQKFPKRKLIAVFQPHTFSRTEVLLKEFAGCFKQADLVGIMEIYGSAREKGGRISGRELANAISKTGQPAEFLFDHSAATHFIKSSAGKNDIVVLMGAGDVNKIADLLIGE